VLHDLQPACRETDDSVEFSNEYADVMEATMVAVMLVKLITRIDDRTHLQVESQVFALKRPSPLAVVGSPVVEFHEDLE
jgi:hypothetical protein